MKTRKQLVETLDWLIGELENSPHPEAPAKLAEARKERSRLDNRKG